MTKVHLTFIAIGLMASSLLASCKKDNSNDAPADGFRAVTEQHPSHRGSKTHGEPNGDTDITVKWTDADEILVANGNGTAMPFELTSGVNSTSGIFSGSASRDFFLPDFVAIYPRTNAENTPNTISGNAATFHIPAAQNYQDNSFDEKAMPMTGRSSTQTLQFKNVFGGICFPIAGNGITIKRIELVATETQTALWGTYNADIASDGMPNGTMSNSNANKHIVTLNCGSGIALGSDPIDFYIMLPPTTLNGFSIFAYNQANEVVYEQTTTQSLEIPRNMVRKLNGKLDFITVETTSPTFISFDKAWVGGRITGGTPSHRGVVYATQEALGGNPDNLVYSDAFPHVEMSGNNFKDWTSTLQENKIYYVRAYAINTNNEVFYGDPIPFATRRNYAANGGKLNGLFSVGSGGQRYFAMGNLQYKASENKWRYAEYQFEYVGYDNLGNVYQNGEKPNTSASGLKSTNHGIDVYDNPYDITTYAQVNTSNNNYNHNYQGWIDWFLWGTSGQKHNTAQTANALHQPWCRLKHYTGEPEYAWQNFSFHNNYLNYDNLLWAFNDRNRSLEGTADWAYNTISNGSATGKHTPSANNWQHLLKVRNASTVNGVPNARFSFARLNVRNGSEVRGIFLFPDSFTWPALVTHYAAHINVTPEPGTMSWNDVTVFTEAEWTLLEQANVVFLPCCGCYGRTGHVEWGNRGGRYWSSSPKKDTYGIYTFAFSPIHEGSEGTVDAYSNGLRYYGFAVRFMIP